MNALHLPYLADDRIAEYRRQADQAQHTIANRSASSTEHPEARIPRRGPLQALDGLRGILRAVFA